MYEAPYIVDYLLKASHFVILFEYVILVVVGCRLLVVGGGGLWWLVVVDYLFK